jgi:hypothetical protein
MKLFQNGQYPLLEWHAYLKQGHHCNSVLERHAYLKQGHHCNYVLERHAYLKQGHHCNSVLVLPTFIFILNCSVGFVIFTNIDVTFKPSIDLYCIYLYYRFSKYRQFLYLLRKHTTFLNTVYCICLNCCRDGSVGIVQGCPNRGSRATCGSLTYNVRLAEICWLSSFLHYSLYKR